MGFVKKNRFRRNIVVSKPCKNLVLEHVFLQNHVFYKSRHCFSAKTKNTFFFGGGNLSPALARPGWAEGDSHLAWPSVPQESASQPISQPVKSASQPVRQFVRQSGIHSFSHSVIHSPSQARTIRRYSRHTHAHHRTYAQPTVCHRTHAP